MPQQTVEESMLEKLEQLVLLPQDDKNVLREALSVSYGHAESKIKDLSIFLKDAKECSIGIYKFRRFYENLYYCGFYNKKNLGLFFDENKKILFGSRHYLTHLHSFLQQIDACLENITNCDISKARCFGGGYIAVEKWFYTYGHFKDEIFTLANFADLLNEPFRKVLLDYPSDKRLNTESFSSNSNYELIKNLIFGQRALNTYEFGDQVLLINDLVLVENGFDSEAFHSFPPSVTNRIRSAISHSNNMYNKYIFVTRSASYRDIANKNEVETKFISSGYELLNPELVSYEELVYALSTAERVAMYYGSAMTNLIYAPKGAKITILKAQSYMEENLDLWRKVIRDYLLDVTVVDAEDNVINLAEIDYR